MLRAAAKQPEEAQLTYWADDQSVVNYGYWGPCRTAFKSCHFIESNVVISL